MTDNKKDWIGGTQNVMATLNASSHSKEEREQNDYYATPPKAVEQLLNLETFQNNIWECACGEGHISKVLEKFGHNVRSTDLIDRNYGDTYDFLKTNGSADCDIITNPPFSKANEFLLKAMDVMFDGRKLAMLLRIQFLEGVTRRKIFKEYPPKVIYVASRNIRCAKNGDFKNATGNASTYCWFVWEKGFKGEPIIRWFND